ncbi:MAG: hypothetical protein E6Q97_08910 [Desulfurellales bacterium]|nr:MAG: hypothetical protein E6Q97_08910 [Desulfurellales bacterium]
MANLDGVDEWFRNALERMIADAPGGVSITSGFRSVEHQQRLWDQAVARYGSEQAASHWVARPGGSNHNHGVAVDLHFSSSAVREWFHANASRYGLGFPMDHEPWHIEPYGVRNGTYQGGNGHHALEGAYTSPLPGLPQGGQRTFQTSVDSARSILAGALAERRSVSRPSTTVGVIQDPQMEVTQPSGLLAKVEEMV